MLVDDLCEISKRGGDDIVLANYLLDVFIIEPIFFRGSGVDVVIHDFAVWILLVRSVGEIKIAGDNGRSRNNRHLHSSTPNIGWSVRNSVDCAVRDYYSPSSSWNAQGKR